MKIPVLTIPERMTACELAICAIPEIEKRLRYIERLIWSALGVFGTISVGLQVALAVLK
jgi:hypothetical protein